jgi:hypothetical protein
MRKLNCLRCQREMAFIKREKLQLGQTGMFLGDWPNILAGSLEVEIFGCANCGKLEFFMPEVEERELDADLDIDELPPEGMQNIVGVNMHGVPQVQCPNCGKRHDFDYPKCIYCDFDYYAK